MIAKFSYNGKERKVGVLVLNSKQIEGIELSSASETELLFLEEYFGKTEFKDLDLKKIPHETDPNKVSLEFRQEKVNEDLSAYFKFYRKFKMENTGLNYKLELNKDEVEKEIQDKVQDLEEKNKEMTQALLDMKNEDTSEEKLDLDEEAYKKEQGIFNLEYIESKASKEVILRLESKAGIKYFYAPTQTDDQSITFKQSLETIQDLIKLAYTLGKNDIDLTFNEKRMSL